MLSGSEKVITVTEPSHDTIAKDSDGYRWGWDESNTGWTLLNFEHILAYVGLPWTRVEKDYGPLTLVGK